MKEVGDKFGAGELILPFVLQSAEVMKRAVAQLENHLDRIDGHTKGKVVLATVYGDVHDIGKSLVNTILSNNGYTVFDAGSGSRSTRSSRPRWRTTPTRSASRRCSSRRRSRCRSACMQELDKRGMQIPVLIGGAAINRRFGRRALYPKGRESDDVYEPGVFYCKDAFEGLDTMDALVDREAREALVERIHAEAKQLREKPVVVETDAASHRRRSVVHPRTDTPIPAPPFAGRPPDRRRPRRRPSLPRPPRAVQAALGRSRRQGRGLAQADRGHQRGGGSRAAAGADVARAGLPSAPGAARLLPVQLRRQRPGHLRSREPRARGRAPHLPAPAQGRPDLPRGLLPPARQIPAPPSATWSPWQGVTVGPRGNRADRTTEGEGEFAEQLFVHGLGVQTAEGLAEWLHSDIRRQLGIDPAQGRRYSWARPASDQSRVRESLAPARPRRDRHDPLRRLRGDGAVDAGDHRPPSPGRSLA